MNKFRIILGAIFLVMLSVSAFYLGNQFINKNKKPACTLEAKICPDGTSVSRTGPNCEFSPCPMVSPSVDLEEIANWKIFTNEVYKYFISAPEDFNLKSCEECNPPEINFGLYNSQGTVEIGAEYAHQWSLTANMSSAPIPVKNLEVIIQGKKYQPEEYFDQTYHKYIFKIDDIENNGQFSQISLSGSYSSLNDAGLVSKILSSFEFLNQEQEDKSSGIKTHTDSVYNFSIKYPSDWIYQNSCEDGGPEQYYPCFHSPDFKVIGAGILFGNPLKGGEIILFVNRAAWMNSEGQWQQAELCPKNVYNYKFPCERVYIGDIEAWRSIVEGSEAIPSDPVADNTIHISFIHKGKYFRWTGYYNDQSKNEVIGVFDKIISTFQFL